jgi:hypothetical protein
MTLVLLNACVEWGESLTFDMVNNTDRMITVRQFGVTCYACPLYTMINLDIAEKISFSSYEDSGSAPDESFREISKMIIIYNFTIHKQTWSNRCTFMRDLFFQLFQGFFHALFNVFKIFFFFIDINKCEG